MDEEGESEVQSEVPPPRWEGVNFFLRFGSARPMATKDLEGEKFGRKKIGWRILGLKP